MKSNNNACALFLATLLLSLAGWALGAVQVEEIDHGGVTHLRVKNEFFDLEFAPEKGGTANSFKTRYSPNEWIYPGGWMFMDRFVGENWPGPLSQSRYDYRIVARGPDKAVVEFQCTTKDNITVFKHFTVAADSPVIQVSYGLMNQSAQPIVCGLWPQSVMYVSGSQEYNRLFRPSSGGINIAGWDEKTKQMVGDDYVKAPYAGWTAAMNTRTREGLVWLVDYNWLKWLYNCPPASTVELVYEAAPLPKQTKWETEYDVLLVKGFTGVCHASANLIADMQLGPSAAGDTLAITHTLGRSTNGEITDAKLTATLRGVDSKEAYPLPALEVGNLSWEPKTLMQSIKANLHQRLVCEVALTGTGADGKPIKETYSYYWPGLTGGAPAAYTRTPPRKMKVFPKPKDLAYFRKAECRMLEFRGLFHANFRVPEAATRAGISEIRGSYFTTAWTGNTLSYLPTSFDEMFDNDLVVINDVDAESLTDFGQETIVEFVKAGGCLLVLNGPNTFGHGGIQHTRLADLLPVNVNEKSSSLSTPVNVAPSAKILKGVRFQSGGRCCWLQDVQPKPGAWVELTAGPAPFLICGRYGRGKVAVV
ncbi:MAG TPA: hypothetical protein VGM23_04375, partial [Armatimonadota bacterium]